MVFPGNGCLICCGSGRIVCLGIITTLRSRTALLVRSTITLTALWSGATLLLVIPAIAITTFRTTTLRFGTFRRVSLCLIAFRSIRILFIAILWTAFLLLSFLLLWTATGIAFIIPWWSRLVAITATGLAATIITLTL